MGSPLYSRRVSRRILLEYLLVSRRHSRLDTLVGGLRESLRDSLQASLPANRVLIAIRANFMPIVRLLRGVRGNVWTVRQVSSIRSMVQKTLAIAKVVLQAGSPLQWDKKSANQHHSATLQLLLVVLKLNHAHKDTSLQTKASLSVPSAPLVASLLRRPLWRSSIACLQSGTSFKASLLLCFSYYSLGSTCSVRDSSALPLCAYGESQNL